MNLIWGGGGGGGRGLCDIIINSAVVPKLSLTERMFEGISSFTVGFIVIMVEPQRVPTRTELPLLLLSFVEQTVYFGIFIL